MVIIVLAAVIASAAIAGPVIIATMSARQAAQKKACQANQRSVEGAIREYAVMSPDESYPTSLQDLVAPGVDLLKSIPTCPSGNRPYIWVQGGVGVPPHISCPNNASHAL